MSCFIVLNEWFCLLYLCDRRENELVFRRVGVVFVYALIASKFNVEFPFKFDFEFTIVF